MHSRPRRNNASVSTKRLLKVLKRRSHRGDRVEDVRDKVGIHGACHGRFYRLDM